MFKNKNISYSSGSHCVCVCVCDVIGHSHSDDVFVCNAAWSYAYIRRHSSKGIIGLLRIEKMFKAITNLRGDTKCVWLHDDYRYTIKNTADKRKIEIKNVCSRRAASGREPRPHVSPRALYIVQVIFKDRSYFSSCTLYQKRFFAFLCVRHSKIPLLTIYNLLRMAWGNWNRFTLITWEEWKQMGCVKKEEGTKRTVRREREQYWSDVLFACHRFWCFFKCKKRSSWLDFSETFFYIIHDSRRC